MKAEISVKLSYTDSLKTKNGRKNIRLESYIQKNGYAFFAYPLSVEEYIHYTEKREKTPVKGVLFDFRNIDITNKGAVDWVLQQGGMPQG